MKRKFVIHPILFAIYPVLSLYSHNIDQMAFTQILGSGGIVLGSALILFLLPGLIFRNFEKTGIIVSAFVILFLAHRHIDRFADCLYVGSLVKFIEPTLFILGTLIIIFTRRNLTRVTQIANLFSACLIIIALGGIAGSLLGGGPGIESKMYRPEMVKPSPDSHQTGKLPDIYYIILDGYGRADILREIYDHDNTEFLDNLRQKGFRIVDKGRSNYCQTLLSLSSTFNLTYLDSLAKRIGYNSRDRKPLIKMVKNSYVFDFLKQYDYTTIAFACGYSGVELRNADRFLSTGWSLNEFDHTLINNSALPAILDRFRYVNQYDVRREEIDFAFDQLADLPETGTPRLVFAPVVAPHPPFVFGPNGEKIENSRDFKYSDGSHYMEQRGATPSEYIEKYRDQLNYVNKRVMSMIDKVLSRPGEKPIIILQADHGPGSLLFWEIPEYTFFKERLSILNAYYLPDGGDTLIYDDMTPINTFRLIFNHYFGTDFEKLEDRSYFTRWSEPYRFIDVTETIVSDEPPPIRLTPVPAEDEAR